MPVFVTIQSTTVLCTQSGYILPYSTIQSLVTASVVVKELKKNSDLNDSILQCSDIKYRSMNLEVVLQLFNIAVSLIWNLQNLPPAKAKSY